MNQLASLLSVWSLCCCFQENLIESFIPECASGQMTVQWPNGTFKQCLHCEHCHPGRGLYPHKCGDTVTFPAKIECKKCDSGKTYSDTYDSSRCKLCHSCAEHEDVTKNCTLSSDTKCNKTCNSDYFFNKPQQGCKRCSYCCLDGKDEEQPQCINKGLKAVNRYCSPRPDRSCNPSTPKGSVIPTESRSSPKHLNEPTSQQNGKIVWILSCVGTALLLGLIILLCYLWRKTRNTGNGQNNVQAESNLEGRCAQYEPREDRHTLTLQDPGSLVVQLNCAYDESPASTPEGHHKRILRTAGESARMSIHANKGVGGDVSDNFAGKGQSWPPEEVNITLFPDSSKNSQAGSRVEFHCTVKGCQQVLYRWFKDGQELPGKDNSTLILDPLEVRHFGFYYCEVRSDKSHELSSVDSKVVELDVTPAGGKSYRRLAEVFDSDLNLRETVANTLEEEIGLCRKAYRQVAFQYKMKGIDRLERCKNPGEDVLDFLKSTQPDLTVYHFCKVLKGENIRRLDIVIKLLDYLI
ncbi:uncharacterized protein LOC114949516 isoform X1 [Acropora millepora]|uniref:uncharacterized protein LOC114949516 isoform X1 n=1 Tax=Acropora millepora TaxID=45264 RepID=UPI001CF4F920|nr:uncharacterized protein LOC114949516 isoform X1 [Acropora millepora]XP_029181718.2 uncharacterized protein LOC114949516 isoform X1 [Acropora millepora]XP_029181719.2 uncharacterized protein LOC114949516 isoform X1 [Acropora millepora]XP_029181720.2 uncharacterized protein LOC114949516 isoform X1 [Acropora millepora]XP_044176839.1 uncharacterized protein LOC114949516 isoform X1 [Acropora millepora]